ncbi:protein gamete expressed 1 [Holotrichia oblita]|uniref:Protein gamete expressed 1 n=1 Tax=Holotrichia oblita TaxID=644536 RepID=A0ACB9TG01_HOLOL|nr:protein gamete expressed 1 [Holotrichia oblita]
MHWKNCLLICMSLTCSNAFVSEYFKGVTEFFGFNKEQPTEAIVGEFNKGVLYEVSTVDEKFISEAAKLTGVALSELDKCQQRIILQLNKGCNQMNDEDVSKMAVMLLNCQSSIEGRRVYHCTHEMAIKECTKNMDPDTWNTYHLMTNRVRAVCYTARQSQFIGLTEHTINKLVDTTRSQVHTLDKLVNDQKDLQHLAEDTLESVKQGHSTLSEQQKDLQRAHLFGQLLVENNLRRLAEEKYLISQTHQELTNMAKNLQNKLEFATGQLTEQSKESSINHREILQDLLLIQQTAHDIFRRIEDSSTLLIEQSERAHQQYVGTLKQLAEVNKTVNSLANLVYGTRQILEDRLNWISTALGGTDVAVDRLYLLTWHIIFIILSMIASSFIELRSSARILVVSLPCLNLAVGLNDLDMALKPLYLTLSLIGILIVHAASCIVYQITKSNQMKAKLAIKVDSKPQSTSMKADNCTSGYVSNTNGVKSNANYEINETNTLHYSSNEDTFEEYCSPTPPLSRSGYYSSRSRSTTPSTLNLSITKKYCVAKTRLGTPCKLTSIPGRDYCHRHLRGDSLMG